MNLAGVQFEDCGELQTYHGGRPTRVSQVPLERRHFVAWDGEGINLKGPGKPQSYILLGCSTGDRITAEENLSVFECMDFMLRIAEENMGGIHVGFAFNYDANMILRTLHESRLRILHKHGAVRIRRPNGINYRIEWRPSKWFQITRFGRDHDAKKNPNAKTTIRIYDLFGFFASSFIKACDQMGIEVPTIVREGKANRSTFTISDLQDGTVENYWRMEIELLRVLAEQLRRNLYGAGLRISQWHGPGALASYTLRNHHIDRHMEEAPDDVRESARYAYAGGRFEMYSLGRHSGPVYSMDINSAYPHGIRDLPSLLGGRWTHADGSSIVARRRLSKFGVYRIRLLHDTSKRFFRAEPSPLFYRDKLGNISYPWYIDGWYWSPEALNVLRYCKRGTYEIVEGWDFEPANDDRPFDWVEDAYDKRREWKEQGIASQLALKLMLNSLYGKMAQRVGWDEENRTGPRWHQLEWAGWVTSNCRAMLWDIMRQVPYRDLIAVETDGLYLKKDPAELGIKNSKLLGEWEVEQYDELMYVQSGLAWLRKGDCRPGCEHSEREREAHVCAWTCKRRGLDAGTFALADCTSYLRELEPRTIWPSYRGETTRFIGLGSALASSAPTKTRLGVWETRERDVNPGQNGKRVHMYKQCQACADGYSAYDAGHDMMIKPNGSPKSYPHDIPWENGDLGYTWRERELEEQGLVVSQ